MEKENALDIIAYLKPHCGWSRGMRAVFQKYGLAYEDKDIVNNPAIYAEMVEKSGQPLSPCVVVNGVMLADVSGEEVESYLLSHELVEPNTKTLQVPINQACSTEEHARMKTSTTHFF